MPCRSAADRDVGRRGHRTGAPRRGAAAPQRPRSAYDRAARARRPSSRSIGVQRRADELGRATVTGLNLDVIFPVLHGPYGEDGTMQGLLELANVPYVGAGVLASAVGMDKATMKLVFAANGLPVCPYRVVLRHEWERARERDTRYLGDGVGFPDVREAGEPRIERRGFPKPRNAPASRGARARRLVRPEDRRRGRSARRTRDRVRGAWQRRSAGLGRRRSHPVT